MCPHVAGAVRETRPAVPLVLGGWDRFKQPLTWENSLLKGFGTRDAEGVPAVPNPRTRCHIERHRDGTGHDYPNGSGLLCGISLAAAWGWDGGGLARPAVARSGIDECCGQDFGPAQGVVMAARGLLPAAAASGVSRCLWPVRMSTISTILLGGITWCRRGLLCLPIAAVSAFCWVREPSHHRDAFSRGN